MKGEQRSLQVKTDDSIRDDLFTVPIVSSRGITVAPRYDCENNWEVLFRLNASIWKQVIPWCLANTALAAFLYYYDAEFATMFSTTDKGHTFLSACVSYLLVSRTKICLDRYHAQRQGLSNLVRTCRELVSHSIVFTRFTKTDEEGLAELKQWRTSIAKRTISLLKVIVSILQYPTTKRDSWEIEDLPSQVKKALKIAVGRSNERSPLIMTLFLRTVIMSHEKKSFPPLKLPQEMLLLQYTSDILKAYTGIMDYMSSPYPFPLMNMNRTIVLFYIFTLPFALVNDIKKIEWCFFMTFFITYGILGLELICVELDDPFGEDPNDFDVNNIARSVYKDIIVYTEDVDGKECAEQVRNSILSDLNQEIQQTVKQNMELTHTKYWETSLRRNISTPTMTPKSSVHEDLDHKSEVSDRFKVREEEEGIGPLPDFPVDLKRRAFGKDRAKSVVHGNLLQDAEDDDLSVSSEGSAERDFGEPLNLISEKGDQKKKQRRTDTLLGSSCLIDEVYGVSPSMNNGKTEENFEKDALVLDKLEKNTSSLDEMEKKASAHNESSLFIPSAEEIDTLEMAQIEDDDLLSYGSDDSVLVGSEDFLY